MTEAAGEWHGLFAELVAASVVLHAMHVSKFSVRSRGLESLRNTEVVVDAARPFS